MQRAHRIAIAAVTIATVMVGARATLADELRPNVQADLGLAVIGLGFEHPIGAQLAVGVEAHVFSTYFAPWFDVGDRVDGQGGQVRLTWFQRSSGRGLYDIRVGGGVQYLRYRVDTANGQAKVETPFIALDLIVAYRL